MNNKRIFIEKIPGTNMEAENLLKEFQGYLALPNLKNVRLLNVYDLFNVKEDHVKAIVEKILYESPIDNIYYSLPPLKKEEKFFRIEYHQGEFNQREDATLSLIRDFLGLDEVNVHHSKIIILEGINQQDLNKIKSYYINPIESKEVELNAFQYELVEGEAKEVEFINGFIEMNSEEIAHLKEKLGLGLDMDDLLYCQDYFIKENREPSLAELKMIDTYWSDHCRHTTFMTEIIDIDIEQGKYQEMFEEALGQYIDSRKYVYENNNKPMSLMDLATINMKETLKNGSLDNKEASKEINAASIEVDVDVNGKNEKWLLMFKNETHNHPTEMEPFGGAGTCLGGAIRDPLSGRAFVYQAMRITGAGDPTQDFEKTLTGKLPQRKITRGAMEGYSDYGNQIGVAAGYINEFYHPGFIAKRMELGALVAAAPKDWVFRGTAQPGDLIVLVGGKTGRDGLGGAVGSSKVQTTMSLDTAGAEVQKGNPPIERKIIRLFRNPEATRMIKVSNDFGAGGVSVAVGELAEGLYIDLDKVPLKYPGLNGGEIALSESQERMAVVIAKEDLDKFIALAQLEDLEASVIAKVTDEKKIQMVWRGKTIININKDFLDTNGIRKKSSLYITNPQCNNYLTKNPNHIKNKDLKEDFILNINTLNTASQKGLIERFDNTIGSISVLSPLGGKYKLSPQEGMVGKIPVLNGETNTCSIMTCGYDPFLFDWSTFHGGYYSVIASIAKVVALGGDYKNIRLTFQEYFEKLENNPYKWAKPFTALLGAFMVQKQLNIPSIGGKDSMSGSFEDLHVPPSLISFAVVTDKMDNIISKEFKKIHSKVVLIPLHIDEKGLVDFNQLKKNYTRIKELANDGKILSSSSIGFGGIARSVSEMAFGNRIGFRFEENINEQLFKPLYGSILLELDQNQNLSEIFKGIDYTLVGSTIEERVIIINKEKIDLELLIKKWLSPLEEVFPIQGQGEEKIKKFFFNKGPRIKSTKSLARPKVLLPVFTGTNGEYDMAYSFIKAGADVDTFIFNTLTKNSIEESYKELCKRIGECQIIGFPNGSLYGAQPESSGKLLKIILNNPYVKEAIHNHLYSQDGLILGIGESFNGLIKSGLIEKGEICDIESPSFYISHNISGEFLSTMADIEVVSNLSPWMMDMDLGNVYTSPLATREGRILLLDNGDDLLNSGQIATQFAKENITGSQLGIESLTSPDGRVLGTISSIDRLGMGLYKNVDIKAIPNIFKAGVKYFK
ncbi:MAG TPA: phosphoribosylformylglycinamidine synthase [Eubacteriaceae bacterium]|nr:phosphoribosylformylglycinamidine synthase [Eubacteriaceae bacterium]